MRDEFVGTAPALTSSCAEAGMTCSSTPSAWLLMPTAVPRSENSGDDSYTCTSSSGRRNSALAVAAPASPPPTMATRMRVLMSAWRMSSCEAVARGAWSGSWVVAFGRGLLIRGGYDVENHFEMYEQRRIQGRKRPGDGTSSMAVIL